MNRFITKFSPYIIMFLMGVIVGVVFHAMYICKGETVTIGKIKSRGNGTSYIEYLKDKK